MAKRRVTVGINETGIDIYSMLGVDSDTIKKQSFAIDSAIFSEEYYDGVTKALAEFSADEQLAKNASVTVILPNKAIAMDTVAIPSVRGYKTAEFLNSAVKALYKNASELKINASPLSINKQSSVYLLSIVKSEIYSRLHKCLSDAGFPRGVITFASSSTVNGALAINDSLKGTSFLMLDIKEGVSFFSFVNNGVTIGFYSFPFGFSLPFDADAQSNPHDEENIVYDNFNILKKQASKLLGANEGLVSFGAPQAVYVNIPDKYSFLFDRANAERKENEIEFIKLDTDGIKSVITENLELYGGFFTAQFNKNNNFSGADNCIHITK